MNSTPAVKRLIKSGLTNSLWLMLGRERLVRFSRFLSNQARLDVANDMAGNGETLVQRVVLRRVLAGREAVIFDVGANVGEWTRALCADAPAQCGLRVHAFEPCGGTRSTLSANLRSWGLDRRVSVHGFALSSSVGEASFYSLGDNAGRNGLVPTGDGSVHTVERVPTNTIDALCREEKISHVDLLKIDTEGHDLDVIRGAQGMLECIDVVQFEYNHRWVLARHFLRDAFELLQPLGYAIGKVTPRGIEFYPGWDMELETFREANFIAVREKMAAEFPQIQWWKHEKVSF